VVRITRFRFAGNVTSSNCGTCIGFSSCR
jgi:hypothetical protein